MTIKQAVLEAREALFPNYLRLGLSPEENAMVTALAAAEIAKPVIKISCHPGGRGPRRRAGRIYRYD